MFSWHVENIRFFRSFTYLWHLKILKDMMNGPDIIKINDCVRLISEKIDAAESYALGFCIDTGSRDEKKSDNGISHFIEHMLFKGTRKRTAKQISVEIEKNGAYLNAFTSKENTCYYARGLENSLEKSFEILSDMLSNSVFDETEIEKEANVIADELNDILDTPEEFIFDEFEKKLYGSNSLNMPVIGTRENILGFTREKLLDYYRKHYAESVLYVVAAGKVETETLIGYAEKYLPERKCRKNRVRKTPDRSGNEFTAVFRPVNQYYSIIGASSVGFTSPDYLKARLLSVILGEGSSSRLFVRLREQKGIAYQINSFVNGYSDVSTFGVYFSTNPAQGKKATRVIFDEMENMAKKGVRKTELEKAKKILVSNIVLGTEDLSARISRLANAYIYSGKINSLAETKAKLAEITLPEINDFAREMFDLSKFSQTEVLDN